MTGSRTGVDVQGQTTSDDAARVLVVDDQSVIRSVLRELLRKMGFEVIEARDAASAIRLIETQSFSLVTLDMVLPGTGGMEVLRRARERYDYSELPIIVISVQDEAEHIVKALSQGANDYVTKPIVPETLAARIETHLAQRRNEQLLRQTQRELEDRVRARTADLQRSNEALNQYEKMINAASDMLMFLDTDYRFLAANGACLAAFKTTREALLGRSMSEVFGESVFATDIKPKLDYSLEGVRVASLIKVALPDQGERTLDVHFDPCYDETRRITGVVVDCRDVSERQRAEDALRALAQTGMQQDATPFFQTCAASLAKTYDAPLVVIAIWRPERADLQTVAVWQGDRLGQGFSYPIAGSPCENLKDLNTYLIENDVRDTHPGFALGGKYGVRSYFGAPLRAQDGSFLGVVAILDTRVIEPNPWSRPVLGIFATRIALEVERVRVLEAIEYTSSLHRTTLESTGSGILVLDANGNIRSYNRQFVEMWSLPADLADSAIGRDDEIVECVASQLVDPEYFYDRIEQMVAQPDLETLHTLHLKDGRVYERYTRAHVHNDQVIGRVVVMRDITEQVQAEQELEQYRNNLEALVKTRTAELEAINREVASFSYSVSHDLRAPLRSIDGFSQMLLEDYGDTLDDNARVYLSRIRNASQRMGVLIDDVLLLSRLSRKELSLHQVDLSPIAQDIAHKLADSEPERDVDFHIAGSLPARADRHLARILLENLLGNAWKYTRKRKRAVIEVGMRHDGLRNVYYVSDNGVGFDMQYAEKLFQPFQRLHSVSEFEGTGIGLATVAQIVRRHGGEVAAEGKLNAGATVYFTLSE